MNRSLALLTRVLERVGTPAPLDVVLDDLARFADSISAQSRCAVMLVDPFTNLLHVQSEATVWAADRARAPRDDQPIGLEFGPCAAAAACNTMVAADLARSGCRGACRTDLSDGAAGGCWSVPFSDEHGALIGVFAMRRPTAREPSRLEADLLRVGARLAGLIIVRHREAERLRRGTDALVEVTERDQTRAARSLHEDVAQQLAGSALLLAATTRRLHPSDAGIAADIIRVGATLTEAVGALRDLAASFAPIEPGKAMLSAALRGLAARVRATTTLGVHCRTAPELDGRISRDAAVQVYRIAEEAVDNVIRHAGARQLSIGVSEVDERVVLEIADDGHGDAEAFVRVAGAGLMSMRVRAARIDAQLTFSAGEPHGTVCRLWVPSRTRSIGPGRRGQRPRGGSPPQPGRRAGKGAATRVPRG